MNQFILGTMRWTHPEQTLNTEQAAQLIHSCFEMGINTIDTADIYGGGHVESLLGAAIKRSNINRKKLKIISKCAIQLPVNTATSNSVKSYKTDPEYIVSQVKQSLHRLQTSYLDMLLIHRPNPLMNLDQIAFAFEQLKSQSLVHSFGASNFNCQQFEWLNQRFSLDAHQFEYALSHPNPLFDQTLLQMQHLGKRCQIWSPLGQITQWTKAEDATLNLSYQQAQVKYAILDLCEKYQCKPHQLLVAWVQFQQNNLDIILGSQKVHRIHEMCNASLIQLEHNDWFRLLEASQGHEVP